jgi:hypothetical protein
VSFRHAELAAGRWQEFTLVEQLANVGSEVSRALNWLEKGNPDVSSGAADRALELLHLTIGDPKNRGRLRELTRVREVVAEYFYGDNSYGSTPALLRGYFDAFARAARHARST